MRGTLPRKAHSTSSLTREHLIFLCPKHIASDQERLGGVGDGAYAGVYCRSSHSISSRSVPWLHFHCVRSPCRRSANREKKVCVLSPTLTPPPPISDYTLMLSHPPAQQRELSSTCIIAALASLFLSCSQGSELDRITTSLHPLEPSNPYEPHFINNQVQGTVLNEVLFFFVRFFRCADHLYIHLSALYIYTVSHT